MTKDDIERLALRTTYQVMKERVKPSEAQVQIQAALTKAFNAGVEACAASLDDLHDRYATMDCTKDHVEDLRALNLPE